MSEKRWGLPQANLEPLPIQRYTQGGISITIATPRITVTRPWELINRTRANFPHKASSHLPEKTCPPPLLLLSPPITNIRPSVPPFLSISSTSLPLVVAA